jgi:hypothetical protein
MTPTPIALLQRASDLGLKVQPEGDHLRITPGRLCPPEFAEKLREHKLALLALLRMRDKTWIELHSERLGEVVYFCAGESDKSMLVASGVEEWLIYTRSELAQLMAQNRIKPLTEAELRKVHDIKRRFNGRIT